jgi:hypothetical protein
MSLARLRHDQGEVQRAREQLAPVYGWFRGFDTRTTRASLAVQFPRLRQSARLRPWTVDAFCHGMRLLGQEANSARLLVGRII